MFILLQNLENICHAINYWDVKWDYFCLDNLFVETLFFFFLSFIAFIVIKIVFEKES